ncbi:MAG: hypothetical protein [Arizlama microvirus]|nr:MAG: hypothetical protein [Arizlama microvirus]
MCTGLGDTHMTSKTKLKKLTYRRSGAMPLVIASRSPAASSRSPTLRSQNPPRVRVSVPDLPVDRRLWNPEPEAIRPAKRFSGVPARVVAPPPKKAIVAPSGHVRALHNPLPQLLFQKASGVAVCVQRKIRKEVLHAKQVAGTTVKPGKRGPYSGIKCNNYG